MRIAIVGAGFTGLSAALKLTRDKHQVIIFEKEKILGGLAAGYKKNNWQWAIEKHYHHWFTNDHYALNLIKSLGLENELLIPSPETSIYFKKQTYPFNSPFQVLTFPHLTLSERIRCGLVLACLKILPASLAVKLEKYTAYDWLKTYFGIRIFQILWQPLLDGKFGKYAKVVNMAWFWARIKKRSPKLAYLQGGYQRLMDKMSQRIIESGGQIKLGTPFDKKNLKNFDKAIFTVPSFVFTQIFENLPVNYKLKLRSIPHLHALNLLLVTSEKFLKSSYWLNINENGFPFIGVIQHTNLVQSKHYGGNHLTWVANYLPPNHPFLKLKAKELFNTYLPFLRKISPSFNFDYWILDFELFLGPFAQPVFPTYYSNIKPDFATPINNVYLANMDMVYPWDRGTNYAIELGYRVAEIVDKNTDS